MTLSPDQLSERREGELERSELLLKLENPVGHRIQQLTVSGQRLSDGDTVDAAFLGEQAVPLDAGRDQRTQGISAVEALAQFVRAQKTVTPGLRGSIRIV